MLVRSSNKKGNANEQGDITMGRASTLDGYVERLEIQAALKKLAQEITEHQGQQASLIVEIETLGTEVELVNKRLAQCQLAIESCDLFLRDKQLANQLTSAYLNHTALLQQINQIDYQVMAWDIADMGSEIIDADSSEKQELAKHKSKLVQDIGATNNEIGRLISARHAILVRDQAIDKSLSGFSYNKKSRGDVIGMLEEAQLVLQKKNAKHERLKAQGLKLAAIIHAKTAQSDKLSIILDEKKRLTATETNIINDNHGMEEVDVGASDAKKQANLRLNFLQEKLLKLHEYYRQLENPSLDIDLCMIELNGVLDHIAECRSQISVVSADVLQQMTNQLLGFVHYASKKYAMDESLSKCLRDAMIGLDQQEDVDSLIEIYQSLCVCTINIPDQVANDADTLRQRRYEGFRQELFDVSSNSSGAIITKEERRFNAAGHHLIKTLNKATSIDIGYRTEVMIAARNLRVKPTHENKAILSELVDRNIDGKASEVMEVTGSVMMIIGAAIIATSIFMAFLSLGFASPLAIAGLALGGVVFASGSALVMASGPNRTEKALRSFQDVSIGFFQNSRCSPSARQSMPRVIDAARPKMT